MKRTKIKKPWSAKKLIFTFSLIGVVLGLLFAGYLINLSGSIGIASLVYYTMVGVACSVGGCATIAGIILLIRGIMKNLKTKQAERTADDVNFFLLTRRVTAEEKTLIKGVFGGRFFLALFYILAVLSFLMFTIIEITAWWWGGMMFAIGLGAAFVFLVFGLIFSYILKKRQLIVTNKRVIARGAFGYRTDIPIKKVTDVSMRWCDGIGCGSPSSKIVFHFCKNKTEVFDTIISESLQND